MAALQDLLLSMMPFEKFKDMGGYKNSSAGLRIDQNHMAPALMGEGIQHVQEHGRLRVRRPGRLHLRRGFNLANRHVLRER